MQRSQIHNIYIHVCRLAKYQYYIIKNAYLKMNGFSELCYVEMKLRYIGLKLNDCSFLQ